MKNILKALSIFALLIALVSIQPAPALAQATTTSTTLTAALLLTGNTVCVNAATGIVVASVTQGATYLGVDQEAMTVTQAGPTSTCFIVRRGALGTAAASHLNSSTVWVGNAATGTGDSSRPFSGGAFISSPPRGTCTASSQFTLPVILYGNAYGSLNGQVYTCTAAGYWGQISSFFVPPTQCTFVPTTLTQTSTYTYIGTNPIFVLNSTSNAAAGTDTLVCTILPPSNVTTSTGAILMDIVLAVGSSTAPPTSLGTSTLSTINLPTPVATTQTASSNTLTAVGGTVTTLGPTTTILTATTAGTFLTFKHTYATQVNLSTDLRPMVYTMPFLQSAGSAMTVYTPGLIVHYLSSPNPAVP